MLLTPSIIHRVLRKDFAKRSRNSDSQSLRKHWVSWDTGLQDFNVRSPVFFRRVNKTIAQLLYIYTVCLCLSVFFLNINPEPAEKFFSRNNKCFYFGWLFYIGTFNSFHNFQSCWNQGSTTSLASRLCVQTLELATRLIFSAPMLMLSVLRHSPTEPPGCLDCMLGSGSAVSCWMFEWFRYPIIPISGQDWS